MEATPIEICPDCWTKSLDYRTANWGKVTDRVFPPNFGQLTQKVCAFHTPKPRVLKDSAIQREIFAAILDLQMAEYDLKIDHVEGTLHAILETYFPEYFTRKMEMDLSNTFNAHREDLGITRFVIYNAPDIVGEHMTSIRRKIHITVW